MYGQSIIMIVRAKKGDDKMSPLKKGTKLTDNPKSIRLEIRLTQSENEMLEECAKRMKTTKTDVLMKGVELVKKELG